MRGGAYGMRDAGRGTRDAMLAPRGFALLAVLWVMVGMAALALAISLAARHAVATANNRGSLARARWIAEGCLARSRVVIAATLDERDGSDLARRYGWGSLDSAVASVARIAMPGCRLSLRAAGSAVDVNAADPELFAALCAAAGIAHPRADSLVDALLDWRDADDILRPRGAERAWYEAHERHLPRNGPLASARELRLIRGFDAAPAFRSLLDVEPGRIDLAHAPAAVIAALPGVGAEAAARVGELRLRGIGIGSVVTLAGQLSPNARRQLLARYADLVRLTTGEPDAWILTSRATLGSPAVTAAVEVRLVRAGTRAAIVRRRTWIE